DMQRQRHRIVAIERPEGDEENKRKQIAIENGHPVAEVQLQAERRQGGQGAHARAVCWRIISSRVAAPEAAISLRGAPVAMIRPFAITAMRSHSRSASAMSWVASSTACPSPRMAAI